MVTPALLHHMVMVICVLSELGYMQLPSTKLNIATSSLAIHLCPYQCLHPVRDVCGVIIIR